MSTRGRTSGLIAIGPRLALAGLIASSGAFALSACSSSTVDSAESDGGSDARIDTRRPGEDGGDLDSEAPAKCEAKCKAEHPNALPKQAAIDKCQADNCTAPCIDQSGGFEGGTDDASADAGPRVCGTGVLSVDENCDLCLEAFCCTPWTACYNEPDCIAYDRCIAACQPGHPDP